MEYVCFRWYNVETSCHQIVSVRLSQSTLKTYVVGNENFCHSSRLISVAVSIWRSDKTEMRKSKQSPTWYILIKSEKSRSSWNSVADQKVNHFLASHVFVRWKFVHKFNSILILELCFGCLFNWSFRWNEIQSLYRDPREEKHCTFTDLATISLELRYPAI